MYRGNICLEQLRHLWDFDAKRLLVKHAESKESPTTQQDSPVALLTSSNQRQSDKLDITSSCIHYYKNARTVSLLM